MCGVFFFFFQAVCLILTGISQQYWRLYHVTWVKGVVVGRQPSFCGGQMCHWQCLTGGLNTIIISIGLPGSRLKMWDNIPVALSQVDLLSLELAGDTFFLQKVPDFNTFSTISAWSHSYLQHGTRKATSSRKKIISLVFTHPDAYSLLCETRKEQDLAEYLLCSSTSFMIFYLF